MSTMCSSVQENYYNEELISIGKRLHDAYEYYCKIHGKNCSAIVRYPEIEIDQQNPECYTCEHYLQTIRPLEKACKEKFLESQTEKT